MRLARILVVLATLGVSNLDAQTLDIGGIELRIGQPIEEALKALSAYQVRFTQSNFWLVTQRGQTPFELLGTLSAESGKVASISKSYLLTTEYESQRAYTEAAREVRRRGGTACVTRDVEYTDNMVHAIETRCGAFKLTYTFSSKYQGDNVGGGISLSVGGKY